jgi:hypothetical protein
VSLAAAFFIIGRFIPINNLNLLVIGLILVFTAALFLSYALFNTFLEFAVIYTTFHFYTKNAMKRQTVNDEIH